MSNSFEALPDPQSLAVYKANSHDGLERSAHDLVKRVSVVTDMNMFLFCSFSDLNVFRILRLQDRLLAMDHKFHMANNNLSNNSEFVWTKEEDDELDDCLKKYCGLIPTVFRSC